MLIKCCMGTGNVLWYHINSLSKHFSLPWKRTLWKYSISNQSQQPLLILTRNKEASHFRGKKVFQPVLPSLTLGRNMLLYFFSSIKELSPEPMPSCRKRIACKNQVISLWPWVWASKKLAQHKRPYLSKCWPWLWSRLDSKKVQPGWTVGLRLRRGRGSLAQAPQQLNLLKSSEIINQARFTGINE